MSQLILDKSDFYQTLTYILFNQKLFMPPIFLYTKFCLTQNFVSTQNCFGLKIVLDPKCFGLFFVAYNTTIQYTGLYNLCSLCLKLLDREDEIQHRKEGHTEFFSFI